MSQQDKNNDKTTDKNGDNPVTPADKKNTASSDTPANKNTGNVNTSDKQTAKPSDKTSPGTSSETSSKTTAVNDKTASSASEKETKKTTETSSKSVSDKPDTKADTAKTNAVSKDDKNPVKAKDSGAHGSVQSSTQHKTTSNNADKNALNASEKPKNSDSKSVNTSAKSDAADFKADDSGSKASADSTSGNGNNSDTVSFSAEPASSGGKGMAGVALVASLLALGGTGYQFLQQGGNPEIDSLPSKFEQVSSEVSSVQSKVSEIESGVSELQSNIGNLKDQQDITSESVAGLNSQMENMTSDFDAQQQALTDQLEEWQSQLQQTAEQSQSAIEDKITQVQGLLDSTQGSVEENNDALVVTNVRQLLNGASQQLQAFADAEKALSGLNVAKSALSGFSNEDAVTPLKNAIEQDIAGLQNHIEQSGQDVAMQIVQLSKQINALPLAVTGAQQAESVDDAEQSATAQSNGDAAANEDQPWYLALKDKVVDKAENIGSEIVQDLGTVVSVEPVEEEADKSFVPEEEYFIRQNLHLKLNNAQLAWLRSNEPVYQENLSSSQAWLGEYFNTEDASVQQFNATLTALAQKSVDEGLPTIDNSLTAMEQFSQSPGVESGESSNAKEAPAETEAGDDTVNDEEKTGNGTSEAG